MYGLQVYGVEAPFIPEQHLPLPGGAVRPPEYRSQGIAHQGQLSQVRRPMSLTAQVMHHVGAYRRPTPMHAPRSLIHPPGHGVMRRGSRGWHHYHPRAHPHHLRHHGGHVGPAPSEAEVRGVWKKVHKGSLKRVAIVAATAGAFNPTAAGSLPLVSAWHKHHLHLTPRDYDILRRYVHAHHHYPRAFTMLHPPQHAARWLALAHAAPAHGLRPLPQFRRHGAPGPSGAMAVGPGGAVGPESSTSEDSSYQMERSGSSARDAGADTGAQASDDQAMASDASADESDAAESGGGPSKLLIAGLIVAALGGAYLLFGKKKGSSSPSSSRSAA